MKKLTLTVLAVGFAAALQPLANAQFGSGIVFDPTQAGHAVTQIENEEQSIANEVRQIEQGQQIFTNTVKIATTALQAYNVAKQQYELTHQMILAPRMLYARFLSPTSDLLLLQQISNTYGNSMGWLNSANTGKGAASAYQQVSVPNTNNMIPGYGTASMAGQLQIAAQGATVDISDSVMTNNLQSLGTIRANQTARQTDIANLEAATQTQDPSQQTIMAELQRINQALLLQLRTLQDANQINANLALQQIVAQKQQQDAMKSAFRDSAGYESYYNANITTTSGGCGESPHAGVLRDASKEDRRAWNMGTGLFQYIAQACQSLAATAAPSITAMGIHIVMALATIMLVWFGVQEALASAHGGPGFSMGRFLNLFMLLTFAYVMVNYYDSSIPGLGFSIKGFIDGGTINLVNLIGADGSTTMLNEIHAASSKTGPSMLNSMMIPYYAIVYFACSSC